MTDQQKIHPHTPVQLKTLAVCTSDYFMGFPGPTLAVEVDARTRADDLLVSLINDEEWPASLPESAIRALAKDAIGGEALKHNTRLFPDAHPEEYPNQYGMDGEPYIKPTRMPDSDEWFTVDEDGDLSGPYGTYGEAMCAAWDGAAVCAAWDYYASAGFGDRPTDVYAYFGLALDLPDGYDVRMVHGDTTWEFVLLGKDGEPLSNGESTDSYDTEFDACVAAWQDKLRVVLETPDPDPERSGKTNEVPIVGTYDDAIPPRWTPGLVERDTPDDYPGAGINDGSWMSRVVVYGTDEQDATNLRGVILDALCNRPDVGQSLDDEPTDLPRMQRPEPPVKADLGQITDVWHEDWAHGSRSALRGYVVARDSGYVWFCDVSGTRHTFVEADITYMEPRPEPARTYHELHDGLSALIEGGRITPDTMETRDYQWLVDSLASLTTSE